MFFVRVIELFTQSFKSLFGSNLWLCAYTFPCGPHFFLLVAQKKTFVVLFLRFFFAHSPSGPINYNRTTTEDAKKERKKSARRKAIANANTQQLRTTLTLISYMPTAVIFGSNLFESNNHLSVYCLSKSFRCCSVFSLSPQQFVVIRRKKQWLIILKFLIHTAHTFRFELIIE